MLRQALSKQDSPRGGLGEKMLDGMIIAGLAGPTGDTQHRAPARHHEHALNNPAALAEGSCGYMMALRTRTLTNNWILRLSYRTRYRVHRVDTDQRHSDALCLIKSMVLGICGATSGAPRSVACAPVWNMFSLAVLPLIPLPCTIIADPGGREHATSHILGRTSNRVGAPSPLVRPRISSG
jgi:hypothetical protein